MRENGEYRPEEKLTELCSGVIKHRFICEPEFDAMMSCVYEAWRWENRGFTVELSVEDPDNYELFCEEHRVPVNSERAKMVVRSIRGKISAGALELVYNCAISAFSERLEVIYRFLRLGFAVGPEVTDCLTREPVMKIFEISRRVSNEVRRFMEFVRFTRWENGILCAVIEPRSDVLTMIAPHFAGRMVSEDWMIVDRGRGIAALHPADSRWYLRKLTPEELRTVLEEDRDSEAYAVLWRTFFRNVAIEQRKNPRCQRNFLPNWYRENMTEFRQD